MSGQFLGGYSLSDQKRFKSPCLLGLMLISWITDVFVSVMGFLCDMNSRAFIPKQKIQQNIIPQHKPLFCQIIIQI